MEFLGTIVSKSLVSFYSGKCDRWSVFCTLGLLATNSQWMCSQTDSTIAVTTCCVWEWSVPVNVCESSYSCSDWSSNTLKTYQELLTLVKITSFSSIVIFPAAAEKIFAVHHCVNCMLKLKQVKSGGKNSFASICKSLLNLASHCIRTQHINHQGSTPVNMIISAISTI